MTTESWIWNLSPGINPARLNKKNSHGSRAFFVYMYFEPKPFNVGYAKERATPIPVRFNHQPK
jgi:hypothetical protein